jgi:hypothetical protein
VRAQPTLLGRRRGCGLGAVQRRPLLLHQGHASLRLQWHSRLQLRDLLLHGMNLRAVSCGGAAAALRRRCGGAAAACGACLLHQDIYAEHELVQIVPRGGDGCDA